MTTTTYYSTDRGNGSPHRGLFRRVDDGRRILLEKRVGAEWVDWPDLLRASGMDGNSEYVVITAAEAQRLLGL